MNGAIHLLGIGGIGMSGLARCLAARGWRVSGSDWASSRLTRDLESQGIRVLIGHDEDNLPADVSFVVRSAAVPEDNPEVVKARTRGVPVLKYAQMLGRLMAGGTGIAVAGCHGKTTTTAMIAYILTRAGLAPSFVCGGIIKQFRTNAAVSSGAHWVCEACEYDRSFLSLVPRCAVITNIEEDHLDYYRDLEEIVGAFQEFAALVGKGGLVVGSMDNEPAAAIVSRLKPHAEGFSLYREADWRAVDLRLEGGLWTFGILKGGESFGRVALRVPGIHNCANALAAVAVANWAGVKPAVIQEALGEFEGCARRFEIRGEKKGVLVVDDYGHHPSEIRATLRAAVERYPDRTVWVVFQPHQFSRTRIFLKEFAASFHDAQMVLIPDIYEARDCEADRCAISSAGLALALRRNGREAHHLPTFDEVVSFLKERIRPGTLLVTMGAGNVVEVAERFLEERRA